MNKLRQVTTALLLLLAALAGSAHGQTYTWKATGSTASWGTAGNWNPTGGPPVANTIANFTAGSTAATITLDGNREVLSATFSNVNAAWALNEGTLAGAKLNISNGNTTANESGSGVMSVAGCTLNVNAGLGTFSGATGADEIEFRGNGGTVNFTKPITSYLCLGTLNSSGVAGMIYNLNAANIVGSRLYAGYYTSPGAVPSNSYASTTINVNADQTSSSTITVACGYGSQWGILIVRNGATWSQTGSTLSMGSSSSIGTVGSNGRLDIGDASTTGTVTIGVGGSITVGGGGNSGGVFATGVLNVNNGVLNLNASSDTAIATIGGNAASSATSGGVGTINLNAGGTIITQRQFVRSTTATSGSGAFNFNGGLLQIARATGNVTTDLFGNGLSVNVEGGGACIDTNGNNSAIDLPLGSGTTSDGGLTKLGAGILTLSASNSYNGPTIVAGGTLNITGSVNSGSASVQSGATLEISSSGQAAFASLNTLANSNLLVANGGLTLNGTSTNNGTLVVTGSGAFVILSGAKLINSGTLDLMNWTGGPLPSGIVNQGTILVPPAVWSGSGSPDITWSNTNNWTSNILPTTNQPLCFGDALNTENYNDGYGLAPASLTFTSSTASYTINGNIITLSGDITDTSNQPQELQMSMLLDGDLNVNANQGSLVLSGAIVDGDNGFRLTKYGPGSLTLAGRNTYSGGTVVASGSLIIGASDAILPGSALTVAPGATIDLFGQSISSGSLAISGGLVNTATNNATLMLGEYGNSSTLSLSLSDNIVLAQSGSGTLTVTGSNSHTGGTAVTGGLLLADYTSSATPKLGSGTLTLQSGGDLQIKGNASTAVTESVAGLALAGGISTINLTQGSTTLSLGAITRGVGGAIDFTDTAPAGEVRTTTAATYNVLPGWATFGRADWVARNTTTGGLSAFAAYTTQDNPGLWAANQNVTDTGAGFSGTVSGTLTISSLKFGAPGNSTITIGGSSQLSISNGGILVAPSVGAHNVAITGGNLYSGFNTEMIVNQENTQGALTLSTGLKFQHLTKTGPGTLILDGPQLPGWWPDNWTLAEGRTEFSPNYVSGPYPVTMNLAAGATLKVASPGDAPFYFKSYTIQGSGTVEGPAKFDTLLQPGLSNAIGALHFTDDLQFYTLYGSPTVQWQINNATGTAGGPSGWDLITANRIVEGGASETITISTLRGPMANFDPAQSYSWPIVQAALTGTNAPGYSGTPILAANSIAIANQTQGIFTLGKSADNRIWSLNYTPLTEADAATVAANLFSAINLDTPRLAKVKAFYLAGKPMEALAAYRIIFLQTVASNSPGVTPNPSANVAASYRTLLNTQPSVNALSAQSQISTIINGIQQAAVTDLPQAITDANPVEFGIALSFIGAKPWAGGNSAMANAMSALYGTAQITGWGGSVANQEISLAAGLMVALPYFGDFTKGSDAVSFNDPNNIWGLGEWNFKTQCFERNATGNYGPTGIFNPDGTGLEQTLSYQDSVLLGTPFNLVPYYGSQPWFQQYLATSVFYCNRFIICLEKPEAGGLPGLGSIGGSVYNGTQATGTSATASSQHSADLGDSFSQYLVAASATNAGTGPAIAFTSVTFPYGGYSTFRSQWTQNAMQIFFINRDNLLSGGHMDFCVNQFQLDAYGRTLLGDMEGYNGSTQSHNTIAIDAMSQSLLGSSGQNQMPNRSPLPNRWLNGRNIDFSEGTYRGGWQFWSWDNGLKDFSGLRADTDLAHQRQLFFVRGLGIVALADRMKAPGAVSHHYNQGWNFPAYFTASDIVSDAASQRIYTQKSGGANVFIRNFGPQVSYQSYYMQTNADTTVGPAFRGFAANLYLTDTNTFGGYQQYAATWRASGDQLLLSLVTPGPATADPVASSTEINGSDYTGFQAHLTSGADVLLLSALYSGASFSGWSFSASAQNLLLSSSNSGATINGVILGATLLTYNGANLLRQVPARDFEFTLSASNGNITAWKEICYPADFAWSGTTNTTTQPVYNNTNVCWSGTGGGSWATGANWLGGTAPSGAGIGAHFGIAATGSQSVVSLASPLTLGALSFDHPTSTYIVGSASGPALTFNNSPIGTDPSIMNRGGIHRVEAPIVLTGGNINLFAAGDSDQLQLAGSISSSGSIGLIKGGRGTVHLIGSNSFTGNVQIVKGLLRVDSDAALGNASNQVSFDVTDSEATRSGLQFGGSFTTARNFSMPGYGYLSCIDVMAGYSVTLTGSLGASGFTKTGEGTLIIQGNSGFQGQSGIAGGRLVLDYSINNTAKLGAQGFVFAGGTIELRNGSSVDEAIGANTGSQYVFPGHTTIDRSSGSNTFRGATFFNTTFKRYPGGTMNVTKPGIMRMNLGIAGGIYGGWMTVSGSDWAMAADTSSAALVNALNTYTNFAATSGSNASNTLLTTGTALTGNLTTATLKIAPSAEGQLLNLGANTLTLSTGGMLIPAGNSQAFTIASGTLLGGASADLVVHHYGSGIATINSVIADNGGATALTKTGTGTLVLGGSNTYTGKTYIFGGVVRLGSSNALPVITSVDIRAGGTLDLAGYSLQVGSLSNGGSIINSGTAAATLTLTGSGTQVFTLSAGQTLAAPQALPVIVAEPVGQTVLSHTSATISVTVGGQGLSYQWYKGGVAIIGATNSIYTIASVALADAGDYTVVVSNSGNSVTSIVSTLSVLANYADSIAQYGLDPATNGAPTADPDNDGVPNLLEYVLGGNPVAPDPQIRPILQRDANGAFTFQFIRNKAATMAYSIAVESSTDLTAWSPVVDGQNGATITASPISSTQDLVTVTISAPTARQYFHLRVY